VPRVKKEKVVPNPAEIAFAVAAVEKAIAEPDVVVPTAQFGGYPAAPIKAEPVVLTEAVIQGGYRQPCGLDDAPIGSKIVVIRDPEKKPVLNTPAGPFPLANNDVAYQLPEGAKVRRMGPSLFVAQQLNPVITYPDLVTATAREAIAQFHAHFHRA
tara:strand:- start:544 stop:1011 length:468 start_codon:yes stop_codon:yes gene_type:complete